MDRLQCTTEPIKYAFQTYPLGGGVYETGPLLYVYLLLLLLFKDWYPR